MITTTQPKFAVLQDGTSLNVYHANTGEGLPAHSHAYSHLTICLSGSIVVRKEGVERVLTKDSKPVNLLPDGWHSIEALEDETVFINMFSEGKN